MLGSQALGAQRAHSLLASVLRLRVHIVWAQLGGIAAILLTLPFGRDVDSDFWWHLRTGKLVLSSGIPRTDVFSWSVPGTNWVAHEWLSEVTIYAVQSTFGYAGNVLLFGLAAAGALGLMYLLGRRAGSGTRVLVLLMLLSTVLLSFFITPRPQVFTWLLFAVFVYLLHRHDEGDRVPLWVLPLLMALWSNLHLGFVYGLMVVGIWCVARVYERLRGRDVDLRAPAAVLAGCFVAAMLNPRGPAIYSYVFNYAFQGDLERSVIQEWQRPYFGQLVAWPLLAASLLMVCALLTRRVRPFLVLLSIAVIVLSTEAARNVPFVALLLVPVVASAAAQRWHFASRATDSPVQVPAVVAGAFVCAIGAMTILSAANLHGALSGWSPSHHGYPEEGAAYVREHLPGVRLLNDYTWGGYLIEELYPDGQVFIDGRADVYGPEPVRDYLTLVSTGPGWRDLLDEYRVEAVLLPPGYPLSYRLARDPAWELVFEGEVEQIFVRR